MKKRKIHDRSSITWSIYGALFGAMFPLIAAIIRIFQYGYDMGILQVKTDPLFWIIGTAPFFLGLFAGIGGRQHDKVKNFANKIESDLEDSEVRLGEATTALADAQKFALLGTLSASIAHEIRNPLAILKAYSDQISSYIEDFEQSKDMDTLIQQLKIIPTKIDKMTDRVLKIIQSLQSFSRNSENDPLEEVNVNEIFEAVRELLNPKSKHFNIVLTFQNELENETVSARASELEQVLVNLISNSYDALEKATDDPWIKVRFVKAGKKRIISVTDSGKGIPKNQLEKMMKPFFTTKEKRKGTGLGLSITKRLVEKWNAKFFYDDKNPNTSFVMEFNN